MNLSNEKKKNKNFKIEESEWEKFKQNTDKIGSNASTEIRKFIRNFNKNTGKNEVYNIKNINSRVSELKRNYRANNYVDKFLEMITINDFKKVYYNLLLQTYEQVNYNNINDKIRENIVDHLENKKNEVNDFITYQLWDFLLRVNKDIIKNLISSRLNEDEILLYIIDLYKAVNVFKQFNIKKKNIFVFGSLVKGKLERNSDIDIAVKGLDKKNFYKCQGKLLSELTHETDLIDLNINKSFADTLFEVGELLNVFKR